MEHDLLVRRSSTSTRGWLGRPLGAWLGIAVLATLIGCGGDNGGGTAPPPPPPPPADPNTVSMSDNSFTPVTRTVPVGTTVRWVNNGAVIHNTVSDDGIWASGNVAPSASFSHTFSTADEYPYRCTIHAGMTGTIVVE